jgi:multiple antibiotic resistance protein
MIILIKLEKKMAEYSDYLKIFVGLFAVLNPLGIIPIFISMTSDESDIDKKNTINTVAISVAIILLLSLFFGDLLLEFFGISINSFRIGGGILILLMAISMLHGKKSHVKQTPEEADEAQVRESIGIVPLAMPLLAGPGGISGVIIASHKYNGLFHHLAIAVIILFLSAVIWGILKVSPFIAKKMSMTGLNIVTRIMGLILASIAVEFIVNGLKGMFPALN